MTRPQRDRHAAPIGKTVRPSAHPSWNVDDPAPGAGPAVSENREGRASAGSEAIMAALWTIIDG